MAEERQAERKSAADKKRQELGLPTDPDTFVGRLEFYRKGGIVFVNSKLLNDNIVVPTSMLHGAQEGDKVVVHIVKKGNKRVMPVGEITDVLGKDGENNAEMHAILAEYGLPYSYPEEVEKEAETIDAGITRSEVKRRRDMRDVLTFTIDPRDAKDFDDALSFRTLPDGNYEVGVHIADVTHYVKPGTLIDKEAYQRATSVYLVDRTIPMLPEKLCNEICSLRPDEDKLTYSVIFTIEKEARVLNYDIARTVTRSNRRLTYEEAGEIINDELANDELKEALVVLNGLAKKMRTRRFEQGAIDFEHDEVTFDIDEQGRPTAVHIKKATETNNLIEEFMLLANRTVATHVGKTLKRLFVYRVHDTPDREKLKSLGNYIKKFGYKLETKSERMATVSRNINTLLRDCKGKSEQSLIEMIAIRAMTKAVYSTDNIGHYGLAFRYYTHFTSPIRRYPDMMVHRLLTEYLERKESGTKSQEQGAKTLEDIYEGRCKHCSQREQLAATAERASIKYKQVEFMQNHVGQTFEGMISGVTNWGIYVELNDTKAEGLIPIRELLPEDYYHHDEDNFCVRGEQTGKVYALGDKLRVRVESADLIRRQLNFSLNDDGANPGV